MARNSALGAAKVAKNDEFYTRREDIEAELSHYAEHFRDKVVYCNCDDPAESEFWKFFQRNFTSWGLKRLIATHYETNEQNYSYMIEMKPGDPWDKKPEEIPLPCNGDFRSAACIELLKQADIIVTNPPFSLFREYVAQLMEYGKKFLIIGNKNSITYKEFFPLLKDDFVWIGYSSPTEFMLPGGTTTKKVNGLCRWFTNLDIPKRHDPIDLRGNYYDPERYPKYDNYNAINVGRVDDIPCDYDGVMGVPITFMDKYCPDQFEIIGLSIGTLFDGNELGAEFMKAYREQGGTGHYSEKMIGLALIDTDGKAKVPYGRILIRRKKGA